MHACRTRCFRVGSGYAECEDEDEALMSPHPHLHTAGGALGPPPSLGGDLRIRLGGDAVYAAHARGPD